MKIPINKNILNEVEVFSDSLLKRKTDLQIIIDVLQGSMFRGLKGYCKKVVNFRKLIISITLKKI